MFSAAEAGPTDANLKLEKSGMLYLPHEKSPLELADVVKGNAPMKKTQYIIKKMFGDCDDKKGCGIFSWTGEH